MLWKCIIPIIFLYKRGAGVMVCDYDTHYMCMCTIIVAWSVAMEISVFICVFFGAVDRHTAGVSPW